MRTYNFYEFLIALDSEDFNDPQADTSVVDTYMEDIMYSREKDVQAIENHRKLLYLYKDYLENPEDFRSGPWAENEEQAV